MENQRLDKLIENHKIEKGPLISILHEIQEEQGYLPGDTLVSLSEKLNMSLGEIYRVVTFFGNAFSLEKKEKHVIRVCQGTTCHCKYSDNVLEEIEEELEKIKDENFGEHKNFSLEQVRCLGCCGSAPNVEIDGEVFDKETAKKTIIQLKGEK